LCTVKHKTGKYQEAVDSFKQVVRISPDYAEAYYGIGWAYGEMGKYQEAIEGYKKAISAGPDLSKAHSALGLIYIIINDRKSALKEYEILKGQDPVRAENLLNAIDNKNSP
jgi:tetratricopeptide (TPR) repeat protein